MKLTLVGLVAILGVMAVVVFLATCGWDSPVDDN
jgi:hypothetical protein